MERTDVTVRGEGVRTRPRAVGGYPEAERVDYDGGGFYVVVTEQYYFRTDATLQSTTAFELVDDTECRVAIVSGGGSGLVQAGPGSESDEARRILRNIERYCEEHGLDIERE